MNTKSISLITIIFVVIAVLSFAAFNGLNIGSYRFESISESIKLGLDIEGGVVLVYEAQTDLEGTELEQLMDQTKTVMEKRINEMGLTEPKIAVTNLNRIRIELPGVSDAQEAISQVGRTALLEFAVVEPDQIAIAGMPYDEAMGPVTITGDMFENSGTGQNPQTGQYYVSLDFNSEGGDLFEEATRKAASRPNGSQIAIVLDGTIISAPVAKKVIAKWKGKY